MALHIKEIEQGAPQFAAFFNGSMHRLAEQSVTVVLGLYSFEEGVIR